MLTLTHLNWRAMRAIIRKDLLVALRSKFVAMPILVVPLIIVVFVPSLLGISLWFLNHMPGNRGDLDELLRMVPPELRQQFSAMGELQMVVQFFFRYTFAPLYLILPLMTTTVIAADSFAGEKERKTLEALIYTPLTDLELLTAKLLGGWLPGVLVAWFSFILYCIIADSIAWPFLHFLLLPDALWLILALWVAPATAGLGLGATVLASARANSFQEAYQLGGLIVLPVMMLLIAQISGILYLSPFFAFLLGCVFWGLDALLLWLGAKTFRRSEMLARL